MKVRDFLHVVFFVLNGRVNYYLEQYKIAYWPINPGDYFGIYEILKGILRVNTTRVQLKCSMFYLTKEDFTKYVEENYSDVYNKIKTKSDINYIRIERKMKFALKASNKKAFLIKIKTYSQLRSKRCIKL